jgi:Fanconi-associated nuclease 1
VRLFLRKTASWFRIERLKYQNDIADLDSACTVLQDANIGFADKDVDITIEEAAGLLSLGELKLMAKEAKCAVNGAANKAQLIEGLKRVCNGQGGLQQTCGGQLKLSFDPKGNYVNRTGRFVRKTLDKIGIRSFTSFVNCLSTS